MSIILAHIVTEQRSYTGIFYDTSPFEYGLLATEDGYGIISDTKTDHGSRVELSHRYELLDSINVFNNNGILQTEALLGTILCENNDRVVHDYAISARTGQAYILFPGHIQYMSFNYPKTRSYSATRLNNGSNGYYEDQLENTPPESISFSEPNFYYTWGKLVSYQMYTDEYVIRTDELCDLDTGDGLVIYSGTIPESGHYFPEFLHDHNYNRQSGNCPLPFRSGGIDGFSTTENYTPLGEYVTGIVQFYTDITSAKISISSNTDINQDMRNTDYVYLYNPISNAINPQLPRVGTHLNVYNITKNSFDIDNFLLYPLNTNVNHTGSIDLNLDRNHGLTLKNPKIVNKVPVKFTNIYNSNN